MAAEGNPHDARFPLGSFVRIKSTGQLEGYGRSGKLRYPPSGKQMAYGGAADSVRRITFSLRGDVLYELEKVANGVHNFYRRLRRRSAASVRLGKRYRFHSVSDWQMPQR